MLRYALIILLFLILPACGGGGTSTGTPTPPTIPPTQPPQDSSKWKVTAPEYTGSIQAYNISKTNAGETFYSLLQAIDTAQYLAFGDQAKRFGYFEEDANTLLEEDPSCDSGSVVTNEDAANSRVEIIYQNCLQDGVLSNGTIHVFLEGTLVFANTNLRFTDTETNETLDISGYFSENVNEVIKLNLMITDELGAQVYYKNFSLQVEINDNYYGINMQGELFVSDLGKLIVNTTESRPLDLGNGTILVETAISVTGQRRFSIDVTSQLQAIYQYDARTLPVVIPLSKGAVFDFDTPNTSLTAEINMNEQVTRGTQNIIAINGATGANYNPVEYVFEITQQPINSTPTITTNADGTVRFNANEPGNYTFRLTVTDAFNNSQSVTESLKVLKKTPEASIQSAAESIDFDGTYQADLSIDSDIIDGPFSYKMHYGPVGMQMDDNGAITWPAQLPNFGQAIEVNYAVFVSNEDESTVIAKQLLVQPKPLQVTRVLGRRQASSFDELYLFTSYAGELYKGAQLVDKFEKDGTKLVPKLVTGLTTSSTADIRYINAYDIDHDGTEDLIFIQDSKLLGWESGSNQTRTIVTEVNNIRDLVLFDYTNNGEPEWIISNNLETHIFEFSTKTMLATVNKPPSIGTTKVDTFCDYDGDDQLDIVYSEETNSQINERDIQFVNVANSQLIGEHKSSSSMLKRADSTRCSWAIFGFSIDSSEITLTHFADKDADPREITELDLRNGQKINVVFGNFDGTSGDDILVIYNANQFEDGSERALLISNLSAPNYRTTDLSLIDDMRFHNTLIVFDSNKDGIEEVLTQSPVSEQDDLSCYDDATVLTAYSIVNGTLARDATLPFQFLNREYFELANWTEQKVAARTNNFNFLFVESDYSITTPPEVTCPIDNMVLGEAAGYSNNELFFYGSDTGSPFTNLIQFNAQGNPVWSSDITQNTGVDDFFNFNVVNDNIGIATTTGKSVFINLLTGEVVHQVDQLLNQQYQLYIEKSAPFTNSFFVDNEIGLLLNIENNQNFTQVSAPDLEQALGQALNVFTAQLDDDPQFELITTNSEVPFGDTLYLKAFDSLSGNSQAIDTQYSSLSFTETKRLLVESPHLECLPWDLTCRNAIYLRPGLSSVSSIDKLTGELIWNSPTFTSSIRDIEFRRNEQNIQSAIILGSGEVYILQ